MLARRALFVAAMGTLLTHQAARAQDTVDSSGTPQTAQDGGDVVSALKVEVTGSRIKRTDGETALPVQIIRRDEIQNANWTTAAEIMAHVSANFNGYNDQLSINDGNAPGAAYANLRGIGSQSTLVLLNGRRLANYAFFGQSVDLNSIPAAALERVEILKDGASSIYGTDAIAGVVNFITRKDYAGLEVSLNGEATEQGGANQKEITVTGGYGNLATDRFNAFMTFDWQKTAELALRQRDFSSTAYRPDGVLDGLANSTFPANIDLPHSVVLSPALADGCSPPVSLPHLHNGNPACGYDYATVADAIPPTERVNVIGRATFQLAPDHELFAEYVYSWNDLLQMIASTPTVRTDAINYPASGPYYPTAFAVDNGLSGDLTLGYRTVALGARTADVQTTAQRVVFGAQGTLGGWDYDTAYTYSENTAEQSLVSGYVSASQLRDAMDTGIINPFGPSTVAGDTLLASTQVTGQVRRAKGWMNAIDARASNEFMKLPGGPAGLALGAEARTENLYDDPGALYQSGDVLGGSPQIESQQARRTVGALFVELNLPFTREIEAQLSARYDHYSDFGGTTNPKASVRWQPLRSLVLRASWGTGFRAPSLPELYTPLTYVDTGIPYVDPVRCPVTQADADCGFGEYQTITGGNPALQPETSTQWSAGFILEPVTGTSIALDYWSINKNNAIDTVDPQVALDNYGVLGASNVIRGPVDPAYPNLPGPITELVNYYQNIGNIDTSGIDVDILAHANAAIGVFTFRLNGTYITQWEQTLTGLPGQSIAGSYGVDGPIPRWRHYAALNWSLGPWGATLGQTFQSGYNDMPDENGNTRHVGCYSIWDLQGSYSGFKNLSLTAGVHNLFNQPPPFTNQTAQPTPGYDPTYADPRGTTYYLRMTYAFK